MGGLLGHAKRTLFAGLAAAWLAASPAWALSDSDLADFAEASQALQRGELDAAEAALRGLQARLPYRPEIINNLGVIAQRRGDLVQAATLLTAAAKLEPYYLSIHTNARRLSGGARASNLPADAPFLVVEALPGPTVHAANLASIRNQPRPSAASSTLARLDATRVQEQREMDSRLRGNDEIAVAPTVILATPTVILATPTVILATPTVIPATPTVIPAKAGIHPPPLPTVIPAKAGIHPLPLPDSIEQWRQAWQSQDITAYLAWYAPDFVPTPAASKTAWEARRRAVFAAPKTGVNVNFADVAIQPDADGELVEFKQNYSANNHADQGTKTMRWRLVGGKWRIVSERFVALPKP